MPFLYIFLLFTGLLFYILFKGAFSFYLFGFLVVMPVLLFILYFYVSRKCKLHIIKSGNIKIKGQKIPLEIEIINPTFIPITNMTLYVEISDKVTEKKDTFKINTPVYPKDKQSLSLTLTPSHCGKVCCTISKCRLTDFFKLFIFPIKDIKADKDSKIWNFCVIPEYISPGNDVVSSANTENSDDLFSPDKKGEDPSEVFDIHEYIPGDRLNRIHWKLSARQETTMVKDFSMPLSDSIILFFNPMIEKASENIQEISYRYDAVMEGFVTISTYLAQKGIIFSSVWYEKGEINSMTVANTDDCRILLQKIAFADIRKSDENQHLPFEEDFSRYRYSHMLYFSCKFEENFLRQIFESEISTKYSCLIADKTDIKIYNDYENAEICNLTTQNVNAVIRNLNL